MSAHKLKKICIFILTIFLINCSTTKTNDTNNSIITPTQVKNLKKINTVNITPEWFTQELNNNDQYLYGLGSDDSYDKAINKALADMIQRLQVIVSTNISLQTINSNNNISQKLIQEISTQTADINIPNYNIINQTESNGIFYIQLQININETIKSLQQIIDTLTEESFLLLKNSANKSALDRLEISQRLNSKIQTIKSSLRTLIILASDTNIENQMIQLNKIENLTLNLKRNIAISIDQNNSGYFYESLKKYLRVHNLEISDKGSANINASLKLLDYDSSIKDQKYCISTKVELQISDIISKQLTPKIYTINACSNKGRLYTIDKANQIFYSQLNKALSIY